MYVILFLIIFCACPVYCAPTILIASTDNPKESLHVYALNLFAQRVSEYSNGDLEVVVHYRDSVQYPAFKGEEVNVNMIMSQRKSPIDITVVAAGNLSLKAPVIEFMMLPYIFPNIESAKRLFRSDFINKELNQTLEINNHIRVIGWLIGGFRHMTNSKLAVSKLGQMRGLTIRTPRNRMMKSTYEAFGATVKPLNWSEVPQALLNKTVDGQENPYNVIAYSKFWQKNQKYLTKTAPFLWVGPIAINGQKYNSLPIRLQAIIDKAGMEAAEAQWAWLEDKENQFIQELQDNGMQIIELENKQEWIDATAHIAESAYQRIGMGDYHLGKTLVEHALSITRSEISDDSNR